MDDRSAEAAQTRIQKLFLQNAVALRGFILGLVRQTEAADDILQEVFVVVSQQAETFRENGNFLAWVRGIARNKVFDFYRRNRSAPRLVDDELLEMLAIAAEERVDEWEERRAALARCIQQLAPRARQILELRYADRPFAPPQIADRLGWSVNAVHVALTRARKFLQECTRQSLRTREV